ncbi:flagellar M-ring protein FliF [Sphingomonas sp. S17]|uniref:Flagellar M-ring protein n=3 Tax=Pseudomonadota TaxID=1224 RepID=A0A411LK11_SPHPI|nr:MULTISPECIES: flagellar basal-body MS-ring/collar protein FliF [Sphingomonas]EGI54170.1 flagellar M-ring protein FliF [Sphingomonas sp. S17]MBQ1480301.1 flagellar M-ring protein FliF [Sphingomonas sp.]MCM3678765.1 flagellar M-ring protein FliF [Sphingomonas paucimobilis]MDG5969794.1 flagellar M-ring protein FliF [Sphingomonas paucimobilis]NNG57444.1 flagellar M-ring protein FliF [Sphingomonas paucimobilis]
MSTALTPASTNSATALPPLPEKFANPLRQIKSVMAQPAVRRSAPMALLIGLVAAAALAWMALSSPPQKTLFENLSDADKQAVTTALSAANIKSKINDGTGALTVNEEDYSKARMLLAGQGLPKQAPGGYAILDQLPMGVSRAVEGERLRQARESELARSIEEIDAVAEARVHLAMPEASVFVRDKASPSASVVLKLNAGRALSEAQVQSIINLVASSVPGMKPEDVTVVDQMGGLLSKKGADGASGDDRRIDFQRRLEEKYRTQLIQLLTPLVGAGNFTAEVQADVNLDETSATSERYDKDGALRAETGNWTGNQKDPTPPGGIPGALSNTPPPASTLQQPQAANGANGAPPADGKPVAGGPGLNPEKQSDAFQRAYDLNKQVSVTRAAPGSIKRLTVAVLLRDPATGKRSQMEITQISDLVKSAVGFDQQRNDNVTVISRKFADAGVEDKRAWYDNSWLPIVARNATALVIALLVLLLGVRPLVKAMTKKKDEAEAAKALPMGAADGTATAAQGGAPRVDADGQPLPEQIAIQPAVTLDEIEETNNFDDRIVKVRGFTRDNPARAALAIRDMIRSEAQS